MQQEVEKLYLNQSLVMTKVAQMMVYFPLIEPLLAQQKVPTDFRFLLLEDSLFAANGLSAGLWALPEDHSIGLRSDAMIDERLHPIAATQAAIARLNRFHDQTGNWVAALNRYGQREDESAPDRTAQTSPGVYSLNDDNAGFIIRLLAHKLVLERAFSVYKPKRPLILYPYGETTGRTLAELAAFFRVNADDMVTYNAWLKESQVPADKEYTVFIPATQEQYPEVKRRASEMPESPTTRQAADFPVLQKIAATTAGANESSFYQINGRKGIQAQLYDKAITLAYKGRIKLKSFMRYNDLRDDQPIYAGEIYYLKKKDSRAPVPFHITRRGQSLWEVSQQYGVQLKALTRYNEIELGQTLLAGRILWLQRSRPKNTPVEYYRAPDLKPQPALAEPLNVSPVVAAKEPASPAPFRTRVDSAIVTMTHIVTPIKLDSSALAASSGPKAIRTPIKNNGLPLPESDLPKPAVSPAKAIEAKPLLMHVVERGETYATVAQRYRVSVKQLVEWNNLLPLQPLRPGQALLIDTSKQLAWTPKAPAPPKPRPVAKVPLAKAPVSVVSPLDTFNDAKDLLHVVKPGENLYRIAMRYRVTPLQVQRWNNLPSQILEVGMKLVIRNRK